jgi:hypothetical protein
MSKKYERKTRDEYQIWVKYGSAYGFEHEITEDSWKDARDRVREYRENCPQYPVRIVKKRVALIPE